MEDPPPLPPQHTMSPVLQCLVLTVMLAALHSPMLPVSAQVSNYYAYYAGKIYDIFGIYIYIYNK